LTVTSRSGSTARHSALAIWPPGSTCGLVAKSTAESSVSSRPPGARDVARSSSVNRTGVAPPGAPAASRGRSAMGQNIVSRTGLEVSGGTTDVSVSAAVSAPESGGTPSTGSRKRASSRRAGSP
jgi:hypothetical protein